MLYGKNRTSITMQMKCCFKKNIFFKHFQTTVIGALDEGIGIELRHLDRFFQQYRVGNNNHS
jgi:hypothetical protein